MDTKALIAEIVPPLDEVLARGLVTEFIDIERRYVLGDWEPATLNGGQFAEIAARIIYHIDSGNLNRTKHFDDCMKYVDDHTDSNKHSFPDRKDAKHLGRALRLIYKLRSQRGAVHIDPAYNANELDSMLIVSVSRWIVSEILRIFWSGDTSKVAQAIREIIRFEVPAIIKIDGRTLVLRTDCTPDEEVLLLIHNAGEEGLTRLEIGKRAMTSAPNVSKALTKLSSPKKRQIFKRTDGTYVLTPNGAKYIHDELSGQLSLA